MGPRASVRECQHSVSHGGSGAAGMGLSLPVAVPRGPCWQLAVRGLPHVGVPACSAPAPRSRPHGAGEPCSGSERLRGRRQTLGPGAGSAVAAGGGRRQLVSVSPTGARGVLGNKAGHLPCASAAPGPQAPVWGTVMPPALGGRPVTPPGQRPAPGRRPCSHAKGGRGTGEPVSAVTQPAPPGAPGPAPRVPEQL